MFQKSVRLPLQRSFALFLAFLFSGFWQPLTYTIQAQTSAAKSHSTAPDSKENHAAKTTSILPNHYGEAGPLVRVALATDMTTVALSSSSGLTVRRSSSEKEQILNGNLTA